MSRLDDELKAAFKRQEPSPDFAARLLERINSAPPPEPGFWQRLRELFDARSLRWTAAAATAAIIIAVSLAAYFGTHKTAVEDGGPLAEAGSSGPAPVKPYYQATAPTVPAPILPVVNKPRTGRRQASRPKAEAVAVAIRKEPRPSPEAEAAKERVLFALQMASATLNEAQKAIQDDGPQEKPEPLHNK